MKMQEMQEHIKGLENGMRNLQQAVELHHYEAFWHILRDLRWEVSELKKLEEES